MHERKRADMSAPRPARRTGGGGLLLLGCVDEQGVEIQALGQDEIADVVAADGEAVKVHGVLRETRAVSDRPVRVRARARTLFLSVIFTDLRWVFMLMSTPATVPCTIVPFFSSIVTVSLVRRIKKLRETTRTGPHRH
jgi:hypothetical protein